MHPDDFHHLVECLLAAPPANCAVDCYSREPINKPTLLQVMVEHFGLRYEILGDRSVGVNATGTKPHYYSLNRKAAEFGFQPAWSALECILLETESILRSLQKPPLFQLIYSRFHLRYEVSTLFSHLTI